jgi:hypothetical protein
MLEHHRRLVIDAVTGVLILLTAQGCIPLLIGGDRRRTERAR